MWRSSVQRLRSQPFLTHLLVFRSHSDQLRQLATQHDSLAALEDTVAQGIHSLLVPAPEPRRQLACSPLRVCVSFSLALLCAQARTDSAWVDLAQRGRLPPGSTGAHPSLSHPLWPTCLSSRAAGVSGVCERRSASLSAHASRCACWFAPSWLVRIHLTPQRLDGAVVTKQAKPTRKCWSRITLRSAPAAKLIRMKACVFSGKECQKGHKHRSTIGKDATTNHGKVIGNSLKDSWGPSEYHNWRWLRLYRRMTRRTQLTLLVNIMTHTTFTQSNMSVSSAVFQHE